MFIKIFLIVSDPVWFVEALIIIFKFNENIGVVTRNHTPFHDVAPGVPLFKCFGNPPWERDLDIKL